MELRDNIPVTNLLLDERNPRFEEGTEGQRELLRAVAKHQGDKLVRLAEDIVSEGLNAAELPIVINDEHDPRRYIVLEGNRRIAALKILQNPKITAGAVAPRIERRLKKLSTDYHLSPIRRLTCAVATNREEANHWIELRHTGENQGAGLVTWGAREAARYWKRRGRHSMGLEVIDFVREHGNLSEEAHERLPKARIITSLERLLNDSAVRAKVGVEKEGEHISTKLPREEVVKGLTTIVEDLVLKNLLVHGIYTKKDRRVYLNRFKLAELPDLSKVGEDAVPLGNAPSGGAIRGRKRGKRVKKKPSRWARATVVPPRFNLAISHDRVNDIFIELKTLRVGRYANATAVLFRVFLELSLDDFVDRRGITAAYGVDEDSTLKHKVNQVAQFLQDQGMMTKRQLDTVRRAVSQRFLVASVDGFHAYIHNRDETPDPDTLKAAFDNFAKFFESIWQ